MPDRRAACTPRRRRRCRSRPARSDPSHVAGPPAAARSSQPIACSRSRHRGRARSAAATRAYDLEIPDSPTNPERKFTDAELDAAIARVNDPARLREAQEVVTRTAPSLQRVLAAALHEGG